MALRTCSSSSTMPMGVMYSPDSVHFRSQRYGAAGDDKPENVAVTNDDQLVLSERFESIVDFGTGPLTAGAIPHSFVLNKDP